jgi:hypothetical protein
LFSATAALFEGLEQRIVVLIAVTAHGSMTIIGYPAKQLFLHQPFSRIILS